MSEFPLEFPYDHFEPPEVVRRFGHYASLSQAMRALNYALGLTWQDVFARVRGDVCIIVLRLRQAEFVLGLGVRVAAFVVKCKGGLARFVDGIRRIVRSYAGTVFASADNAIDVVIDAITLIENETGKSVVVYDLTYDPSKSVLVFLLVLE